MTDSERWLFHAHNANAEAALAEVFEASLERGGIEPRLSREGRAPIGGPDAVFAGREISPAAAADRRWDLVVAADNQRGERVPDGFRVRVPHGGVYGLHGYGIVSLSRCNLFVATSAGHRAFLEKHRDPSRNATEILVGGHPRLDRLWRHRRQRGEVLRELGLDPGRPTVAVASHWTRASNLRRFGTALARTILAALPDANVLQTGHPNIWQRVQYDIADPRATLIGRAARRVRRQLFPFDYEALFRDLGALAETHSRFRLLPPDRAFDALAAADVLVSDFSSVTMEFTLFERPIVVRVPPELRPFDREVEAAYRAAGHPFGELEEVGPALASALAAPDARRRERTALRDLCLEYRGTSGRRIVDLLLGRGRGVPAGAPASA